MKHYASFLISTLLSLVISFTQCMEKPTIAIYTSDNQERLLTQQIIETSRLLLTKQQFQAFKEKYHGAKPAPITLKTISAAQLDLYSGAVNTQDFTTHFKELSPKQKNLLICAAGQAEFDSAYVTSQLLSTCFTSDIIETNINPHLSTRPMTYYLQRLIIKNNGEQKKFTHDKIERSQCYPWHNQQRSYNAFETINGNCNTLPAILCNAQNIFSGSTYPQIRKLPLNKPNKSWLVEDCINCNTLYLLTPIDPVNNKDKFAQMGIRENKKYLWACTDAQSNITPKIIEHATPIKHSLFSNNGKYFVTVSESNDILLTDLTIKDNAFVGPDLFLTGHSGIITAIRFNEESTIFVAAAESNIYFWDMQKQSLIAQLTCPDAVVHTINFNKDNTRLVTVMNQEEDHSVIFLWNISDITQAKIINEIAGNEDINGATFTPSGDKIVIETKQRALVLDGLTGNIIMDTGAINEKHNEPGCWWVNAVLMPHQPILITTHHYTDTPSSIDLWNINEKKKICTLDNLPNKNNDIIGIGASGASSHIISADNYSNITQTTLYDEATGNCLNWFIKQPNILQRYLLLHLYNAHKNSAVISLHPDSAAYRILQTLPTAPYNIKEIVEQYLLRPFEKDWKDTCSDFFEKFVIFFNQKS